MSQNINKESGEKSLQRRAKNRSKKALFIMLEKGFTFLIMRSHWRFFNHENNMVGVVLKMDFLVTTKAMDLRGEEWR